MSGSIQDIAMKLTKYTRRKSILLTLKEFHFSSLGKQKPLWWMKLSITSKENFLVTYKEIKRYCISINIVSNASHVYNFCPKESKTDEDTMID